MDSRADSQTQKRVQHVARLAFAWVLCVALRLLYLQIVSHEDLARQARLQQEKLVAIRAPRGMILDRSGEPLALSLPVDSVFINPLLVPDLAVAADILSPVLSLDREVLRSRLALAISNKRGFLWVKRKISPEESQRLRSYKLEWINLQPESQRFYPKGPLAPHVVGSVDHEESGNAGLELSLDEDLRGTPGTARMLTDARQTGIDSEIYEEPLPGKSVTLAIDERIQHISDRALRDAVIANRCQTGSLVVMNPNTGELLAIANYPTFDPNEPVKSRDALAARANQAVSIPFEPGSVFKVITLAAALETTKLRPDHLFHCGRGVLNLYGRVIHDHVPHDILSMADILAKSSNIGAIHIALRVGEERLLECIRRFGFGSSTGIPLPGESAGVIRDLKDWGKTSIGSVAMGHEISTTTVQLAQATAAIVNGGLLFKPRLILKRQRPGEKPEIEPVTPPKRILKPETSITMRQMMEGVVLRGTGTKARLNGYTAGGKTGSAQIFDLENRVYTHRYNASFLGFAPVANPAVVVVVTLNGASKFGGAVAAPVFQEVASTALRILGVPPDLPELPEQTELAESRQEPADQFHDLASADVPPPPEILRPAAEAAATDTISSRELLGPKVPDFQGKTLRSVLEESTAMGVPVEFSGSGIARTQFPAAGSILPRGERVVVQFAR